MGGVRHNSSPTFRIHSFASFPCLLEAWIFTLYSPFFAGAVPVTSPRESILRPEGSPAA